MREDHEGWRTQLRFEVCHDLIERSASRALAWGANRGGKISRIVGNGASDSSSRLCERRRPGVQRPASEPRDRTYVAP